MRKEPNNDCRTSLTWTLEGRTAEKIGKKLDGRTGVRYKSQRLTELGIVLRPYVPHGKKKIGNR